MCLNVSLLVYKSFLAITIVFRFKKFSEKGQKFEYFFHIFVKKILKNGEVKNFPPEKIFIADSEV